MLVPGIDIALKQILIFVPALVVLYFLADMLFFRKHLKRQFYRNRLINIILVIGLIGVFFFTIKAITMQMFLQIFLLNLVDLCVLVLATTGIVLIFKTSVTTNFAQGMMATFGAFFAANFVLYLTSNSSMGKMPKLFLGMFAGIVCASLLGLFVDVVIIRRGKHVTSIGKQMITMGLVLVLMGLIPVIFGTIAPSLEAFSVEAKLFQIGDMMLVIPYHNLYALVITVVVLAILFGALRFTKWGLGVRATASSEIVAGMMGVNTKIITAMSWAIAGGLGSIAAFLYASSGSQVQVASMIPVQVNAFMAAVLGSFSSFGGPIVGALLINLFSSVAPFYNDVWQSVIVYGVILLLVLAKPLGLFGKKTAKKV